MGQGQHLAMSETRADGGELLMNMFLRRAGGIGMGVMFPPQALDAVGLLPKESPSKLTQTPSSFDPKVSHPRNGLRTW